MLQSVRGPCFQACKENERMPHIHTAGRRHKGCAGKCARGTDKDCVFVQDILGMIDRGELHEAMEKVRRRLRSPKTLQHSRLVEVRLLITQKPQSFLSSASTGPWDCPSKEPNNPAAEKYTHSRVEIVQPGFSLHNVLNNVQTDFSIAWGSRGRVASKSRCTMTKKCSARKQGCKLKLMTLYRNDDSGIQSNLSLQSRLGKEAADGQAFAAVSLSAGLQCVRELPLDRLKPYVTLLRCCEQRRSVQVLFLTSSAKDSSTCVQFAKTEVPIRL